MQGTSSKENFVIVFHRNRLLNLCQKAVQVMGPKAYVLYLLPRP